MKAQQYPLASSSDGLSYYFESVGPRGAIPKLVNYQAITPLLYNLAFGDADPKTGLNDHVVSNNADTVRVLATVIGTLDRFFLKFPDRKVLFTGSTAQRTKIYNWIVQRNWDTLSCKYKIYGMRSESIEPYREGEEYSEFVIVKLEKNK